MIISSAYRTLLALFVLSSLVFPPKDYSTKNSTIVFTSGSFLKIKGQTNVNSFECEFDMQTLSESREINYSANDELLKFNNAKLTLQNLQFDCGGKAINKDFHKLLNTKEFPRINIFLKEINTSKKINTHIDATVEIVICDILKTYTIPIDVAHKDELIINGTLPININDFNLEAPKKVLGIIKVSPIIEIEFSLKVKYS